MVNPDVGSPYTRLPPGRASFLCASHSGSTRSGTFTRYAARRLPCTIGSLTTIQAFTIYTFFQLLINFMGGERALIITMYGRPPVSHLWPLNHVLPKVDISDPYTFLAIKRGILQYAWIKPVLALATIIMKATGTYQEGYIGISSGYFWSGLIYNVSISISLYALALFWVCMNEDLKPFRPMPKFLCVKGIIFASYWQGFFLSILVWLGALPDDVAGYTPDNLAASIQDALICFEMPAFALAHWYAFSWHDYADITISAARMPVKHALRDAFGSVDLIQDTKETFRGRHYEYRHFDADNDVLAHEESTSRTARMQHGMRYERAGKRKYWIPAPGQGSRAPLLGHAGSSRARTMSPGMNRALDPGNYGTSNEVDALVLDPEDERLFESARGLEFGDWNVSEPGQIVVAQLTLVVPRHHCTHAQFRTTPLSRPQNPHRSVQSPFDSTHEAA